MKQLLFLICFFVIGNSYAQDSLQQNQPKKWELTGYLKNMQTVYIVDSLNPVMQDAVLIDNLVHNRINFEWFISKHFTFKVDMRNRIFIGELTKATPNYGDLIDLQATNPLLDREKWYSPSWLLVNRRDVVIHSMLDRLYLDFVKGQWEVRLGRQRINWGISSTWNPHDIFNAYNFTDFDYEERPGSDALRVTRYLGMLSKLELAVQAFDSYESINAGLLWQFNKWGYDFQLMSGLHYKNIVGGVGWAGNIKNLGFKGEASYFYDLDSLDHSVTASLDWNYVFPNSLFINAGFLYNSNGQVNTSITNLFGFQLSAKNLYPYRYSGMLSAGYVFSPILSGNLAVVYSPGESHSMFLSPVLTYSIKENWDINLVGQIMMGNINQKFQSPTQVLFLRLKWSY